MFPRILLVLFCIIAVTAKKQGQESSKEIAKKQGQESKKQGQESSKEIAKKQGQESSKEISSTFSYDDELLEKLVRLGHKVKLREPALKQWETSMDNLLTKLEQKIWNMFETIGITEKIMSEIESKMAVREVAFREKLESHDLSMQSFLENYKTPTVLFKARLVSSKDIAVGKVHVFTEVIANAGNGYDNCTGYFTAPVPGTYMFTAQVCSVNSGIAVVSIVANGTNVETTTHRGRDTFGTCVTLTGVSVLDEGDKANVQGSWSRTNALMENKQHWNTFSGILINTVYKYSLE